MQPKSIIIINDVNSNRRGRDLFLRFSDTLSNTGFGTHIPVDILSITFKTSINVMVSNIQVKIY